MPSAAIAFEHAAVVNSAHNTAMTAVRVFFNGIIVLLIFHSRQTFDGGIRERHGDRPGKSRPDTD
jgi:hypothetical protein